MEMPLTTTDHTEYTEEELTQFYSLERARGNGSVESCHGPFKFVSFVAVHYNILSVGSVSSVVLSRGIFFRPTEY